MGSGFVEVGATEIYYETHGSGPAVLFLHAGVADSRMWRGQRHLDGYLSVMFDQRGFGKTDWVPGPYSTTQDAMGVLDQVGVDSAVIVGCSMGAATAVHIAIEHPERVDGLVLVGGYPSGWVPPDGFEDNPLEEEAETARAEGDFDRVVEIDLQMWLIGYGRPPGDVDPLLQDLFVEMDRIHVATESERNDHRGAPRRKLDEHLDEIKAPSLVVVGAHDEPLLISAADYLAKRLSDRPPVIVENAAHLPSLEQPEAFNTVLKAFLADL